MEMEGEEEELQQSEEEKEDDSTTSNNNCYPEIAGEATEYHQLVENAQLFMQKLQAFHSSFGTHFIPPCIGGTTIDLHRLFVEVTSRGGLDQVISNRKWEEVVSAFTFGTASFKKSFLLRKYYMSLLYHFEQAYFLKKKAPDATIIDAARHIAATGSSLECTSKFDDESTRMSHLQANIQIQPGISLVGVIDEKLENGYVVSVNVGSDTLKGILYHISDKPQPFWSPNQSEPRRRKRKKSHLSLVECATSKPLSQGQERSSSNVGHMSNQSSEHEKQLYEDKGGMGKESDLINAVENAVKSA